MSKGGPSRPRGSRSDFADGGTSNGRRAGGDVHEGRRTNPCESLDSQAKRESENARVLVRDEPYECVDRRAGGERLDAGRAFQSAALGPAPGLGTANDRGIVAAIHIEHEVISDLPVAREVDWRNADRLQPVEATIYYTTPRREQVRERRDEQARRIESAVLVTLLGGGLAATTWGLAAGSGPTWQAGLTLLSLVLGRLSCYVTPFRG
jgi:hypothetical protein